ncbi:uncharacterized protein LOC118276803 [Spodoptera frugiperda]|uniref:Uncharacterized protein LOC118276803 n=1 Tax=Spodoptera frugiperda TaxID=7108 RepID=A0A9R0EQI4_SPOFR|nr:uncharacterized protein LOC118276803 [Spodoptera frugiperda]
MEFVKIVICCLILISTCFADVNTTFTNLTDLEQQLNVNKREKQYSLEDDPTEGSEQKRDGRQSTPKNNQIEPKVNPNATKVRLYPKVITTTPKPTMKQVLTKPFRAETTAQRIPIKIPIVLKTAKVLPTQANALRMKILESKYNETIANREKLASNTNSPSTFVPNESRSSDDVILTIDDITRSSTNSSDTNNKDAEDGNSKKYEEEIPPVNIKKPIHYFIDEPEPLPPKTQRLLDIDYKETDPNNMKEIPIGKKPKNKLNKDEIKTKMSFNDLDNDPEVTRISNGTHLISIKRIRDDDRVLRDGVQTMATEERIINKPPKPKPVIVKETVPQKPDNNIPVVEENIIAGVLWDGANKETKDQNCITIRNHNYAEVEEKSPLSTPISVQPIYTDLTQDYMRYLQNFYYNPYNQAINDQYRRNYGLIQSSPNIDLVDNNDSCLNNEEKIQPFYPNAEYQNCVTVNEIQPQIEPNEDNHSENSVQNRIWKNWKDVEIRIRNANTDEPIDIDIRAMIENSDDILKNDLVDSASTPSIRRYGNLHNRNGIFYPCFNPSNSVKNTH